jgi:hypothetical protein
MPTESNTPLSTKQMEAARLVADGMFTYDTIAKELDITRHELDFYRRKPEFNAYVTNIRDLAIAESQAIGIANKTVRIAVLQEMMQRCYQIIKERGEDPEMQKIEGGGSGLLVKNFKSVGYGRNVQTVETYAFDKAIVSEMRELLKQASMELGQWVEKSQSEHDVVVRRYEGIDMDKV